MKKLFTKILTTILTITLFLSSALSSTMISSAIEPDIFEYDNSAGILCLISNYMDLNKKDIVIPDVYDGKTITKVDLLYDKSFHAFTDDNVTETLTYGKNISNTSSVSTNTSYRYELARFKVLKKVTYLYSGLEFNLQSNLASMNDSTYSDSIEEIYIYANGISYIGGKQVFNNMNPNLKIHVTSEEIADQIFNFCKDGNYDLRRDQFIADLGNELPTAEVTVECEDIDFGTVGGFKPTVTVKVDGQPVEVSDEDITIKLYTNADCTDEYRGLAGKTYDYDKIPEGTYYLKATVVGTDTYMGNDSKSIEVHVNKVEVSKDELNAAIDAANSFKSSAIQEDYNATAWDAVYGLNTGALDKANAIDKQADATQDDIDAATKTLNEALESLKKSFADTTELWTELEGLINDAESLDESEFTEDSYANLKSAVDSAKALSKDTATKTQIQKAISALKTAKEGLEPNQVVIPAGAPFAYVRYNYTTTPFYRGTTDESMVGATRIKLTFDCADDTSFSKYFTTNYSVDVGGIISDSEIRGVGEENLGEKGCSAVLNLTSPIESGKRYSIIGYTYGYPDAKDYIFAITKIEFLDDTGHILKTITDATVAKEQLAKAIADAEDLDADKYTAESYAELTKAIDAAKALKDDATVAELNAAKDAINAAIEALKEKEEPTPTKPTASSQTANNTPSTTVKTTRSPKVVKKDKEAAKKAMKQAKITKLTVKSKTKKKITVSWNKVKKAKGYEVRISAKRNFKKVIFKKFTSKKKLTIKNKKIKSKKTYYVRVRAYTTYKDKNGVAHKVYSKWNKKLRKVKVK